MENSLQISNLDKKHQALKLSRTKQEHEKIDVIEEYLGEFTKLMGVQASDICGTALSGAISFKGSQDFRKKLTALSVNSGLVNNVKLASTGDGLLDSTFLITNLIEEVTPMLQSDVFSKLVPQNEYNTFKLGLDVFESIKGMTYDTPLDNPVPIIKKRDITTQKVSPKFNQEAVVFNQQEILSLRQPGQTDLTLRGIATFVAMASSQLGHRGNVRIIRDIYTALITGELAWQNTVLDYGVPSTNRIKAIDLGANWGTITNTGYTVNTAADPILQMSYVVNNMIKRYRGMKLTFIMNPNTNQLLVQNPNVINRTPYIYANNNLVSPSNTGGVTAEVILKYFFGGDLGIDVLIDGSVYTADANDPDGNADGSENYLMPDGEIWIHIDVARFGAPLAEFAYSLAAQNGGLMNPRPGKYMYMVDSTLSQTFEGMSQPRYYIAAGWNGIPRIMRPKDIWTFNVTALS